MFVDHQQRTIKLILINVWIATEGKHFFSVDIRETMERGNK